MRPHNKRWYGLNLLLADVEFGSFAIAIKPTAGPSMSAMHMSSTPSDDMLALIAQLWPDQLVKVKPPTVAAN